MKQTRPTAVGCTDWLGFMITGTLRKQKPKSGDPIIGMMTADGNNLQWWDDSTKQDGRIMAELRKAEIQSASSHGICLKGYEPAGADRHGRKILKYQEWWITPTQKPNSRV